MPQTISTAQSPVVSAYPLATLALAQNWLKLENPDTEVQSYLNVVIGAASETIEKWLDRKIRLRTYTNEEYRGDDINHVWANKGRLFPFQYPVQSVTTLYDDINRSFGSTTEIVSTDRYIDTDKRFIQLWNTKSAFTVSSLQNIRLTYTAGYSEFIVESGVNDTLDFEEAASTELTATLTAGTYNESTLRTEIKTQLEAAGARTYTITYNGRTGLFKIAGSTFLSLLTNSGTNAGTSAYALLGYDTTADKTGATSYEADFSRLGIPEDLTLACNMLIQRIWDKSPFGIHGQDVQSKSVGGDVTETFINNKMPETIQMLLRKYRRENV